MNANLNHTNKNDKEHRSHPHTLYLVNIIFLCCLTIASLLFALITFFGVSGRGMAGMRKFYTARQIDSIREEAEEKERRSILLQIQSSLESGRSTTQMLREIFYESKTIVVVKAEDVSRLRCMMSWTSPAVWFSLMPTGRSTGNVSLTVVSRRSCWRLEML